MIPDGLENKRLAAIRRKAALDDNWSKLKKWMARSQSGIPIWILKCHIPALPPGTRLEDLDLSWRIFHRLESHGFRDRPEKLGRLTVEEFFDISGLAAKSLRELLSSIRGITKKISRSTENARSASIGPGATPKHDLLKLKKWLATGQDVVPSLLWSCRLPAPPPGTRLDALSLSWQVFNSLEASGMCDRVERLGELTVKKILEIPGFGQRSLRELLSAIFERSSAREIGNRVGSERRGQAAAMAARNLEEELIRLLTRNRSSRSEYYAGILVRRSGFDGCGEKTFREIGQEFGITHERVRQICVLLETRLRAAHPPATPFLDQALSMVEKAVPVMAGDMESRFLAEGLSKQRFRLEGILNAAELFGKKPTFALLSRPFPRMAIRPEELELPRGIVGVTVRLMNSAGLATIADVASQTSKQYSSSVSQDFVRLLLASVAGFQWLDRENGWFWLRNIRRNRIRRWIRKILSVAGRLDVSNLRQAFAREPRIKGGIAPDAVLLALCAQTEGCRVENTTIFADASLDWRCLLGNAERTMIAILKKHGSVISRAELSELCFAAGMSRDNFRMMLGRSPLIERPAFSVYGIRGFSVEPEAVQSLDLS